ncbi:family 2 glycosyl transferase, partial [Streptomyces sp. NPDC059411]
TARPAPPPRALSPTYRAAPRRVGWPQPLAALIALAAAAGPLIGAAGWMLSGAAGPLERRDPVQVPAFVAEESGTRDQARTLVIGATSPAALSYSLVRGSGGRLGDAELAAQAGSDSRLDKVVSSLVAGSGADQTDQLGGFAIRYVLVRDGAPQQIGRVLDATPGLSRLSKLEGSALWRVDRQVARAVIVPAKDGEAPVPVASGPVEAHTKIPAGEAGRTLRIADKAAPGWQATLDGKPLKAKTLDGWAQGFELPAAGGRLDLVHQDALTRSAWHWAQGLLALVLLVMALPGRRTSLDDDLPEEETAPAEEAGEGRRARRLREQSEAEAEAPAEAAVAADPYAQIPQQQVYGDDAYAYQQAYGDQGGYAYGQQEPQQPQPQQPQYEQPQYEQPYEPYPYTQQQPQQYGEQQPYQQHQAAQPHEQYPYEPYDTYGQQHDGQHDGQHAPRPDGSPQQ